MGNAVLEQRHKPQVSAGCYEKGSRLRTSGGVRRRWKEREVCTTKHMKSVPIVSVFFQRGRFDAEASLLMGSVLSTYAIGLLGYAGMKVLQPVFLALEKTWAPALLALVACGISVGLNYVFVIVWGMPASYLALTTSVITSLNFLFYFFYLRHLLGSMACRILIPGLLRILVAGALLAGGCLSAGLFVRVQDWLAWSFAARFGSLALGGAAAGLLYLAACWLLRVPELRELAAGLRRRRS